MKYTLWYPLNVSGRGHYAVFTKDIETPASIVPGMEIEGEAWKDAVKVTAVTYNMDHNYCTAFLEPATVRDEKWARAHEDAFKSREWTKLGE